MKGLKYDVIILGGGPSGVTAAYTLGEKNITTLLLDKKALNEIGNKVCGDALPPYYFDRAYNEIGLPKPNLETGSLCTILDHTYILGNHKIY